MRKSRYTNAKTANLTMGSDVYRLRRDVINLIYEAKEAVKLPRITVRICADHKSMLGCARISKNILWITPKAIKGYDLRAIVYHEIAHAVFGAKHIEGCPLMSPVIGKIDRLSKTKCQRILQKIAGC